MRYKGVLLLSGLWVGLPMHAQLLRLFVTTTIRTDVSCACVPLMVSCSGFGLPMHARLLRLFATSTIRNLWQVHALNECRGR